MGLDVWALPKSTKPTSANLNDAELTFRDTYNSVSLANWLARNVDPEARGSWGLAIFTEPKESLNSPSWRRRLLQLSRRWTEAARRLRGKPTTAGYPDDSAEPVPPEETDLFIQECEYLLVFASRVYEERLEVHVSG